ncbi:hypothetical protein SGQ44_17175 [Flavobacterium sp. Fl-77]|uniref:Uncharacterized protein n=1 Tax=Flavobacterium flavipigmentatum TaxID=2893884 RepID=A0AAJ2SK83_9FLAO|nr:MULTISPECIES: hypothetical protein [unclassified Flavobacterium]MDX6183941.1 hypothetical protein [Flavobacterium sp. Fl-33]MDX6187493.1 hypothetical protein [Flavobacterium sp. Fl-77]UFH37668.1 hypothetical protein LNP22_13070 [Flavobacterium sp. F-70]
MKILLIGLFLMCVACGQPTNNLKKVDFERIKNQTVKKAIEALQNADEVAWFSLFTNDAQLYDDGNKKEFKSFFKRAIGHEKFTSIDKIENNSLLIYGKFHSDLWGNFQTYFKFKINDEGKIERLDIGQADY